MDGATKEQQKVDDPLENFLQYYLEDGLILGYSPAHNTVRDVFGIYGYTQYCVENFQVQVFVVPPYKIIPEHTHPNVDSFEVYLGGQILFSHNGKWATTNDDIKEPTKRGTSKMRGKYLRVRPNDSHGGCFGPAGGVFMSVQRWLNGTSPSCVSLDYDGIALADNHEAEFGNVIHKDLTWKDAAPLEITAPFWEINK